MKIPGDAVSSHRAGEGVALLFMDAYPHAESAIRLTI
jgi:hypothetical protein